MPAAMAPEETSTTPAFGTSGDLAGPVGEGFDGEAFAVVGDQGAADLDDQPAGVTD
jgi:hypothetical protein